jgi:hypothetical protein
MNATSKLSPLSLVIGVAIAWLCLFSPQSASAQATVVTDNFRIPFAQVQDIPGIGLIEIEYESHGVLQSTITPSGRVNGSLHFNIDHFEGIVVASGLRFHGSQSVNGHENFSGAAPYNASYTVAFTAITQGSADNLIMHTTLHITVNANGETTVEIVKSWAEYKG